MKNQAKMWIANGHYKAKYMSYDFKDYKNNSLTLPRDLAWNNWAKFEKKGDSVQGFIRDVFYRKQEGEFKEQRGVTLETERGEIINVSIKRIPFILAKTDNLRLGDPLTVVYEGSLPPRQKGYKGAKQFTFYGKNLEENKDNKTVMELDREDFNRQMLNPVPEEEDDGDFDGVPTE